MYVTFYPQPSTHMSRPMRSVPIPMIHLGLAGRRPVQGLVCDDDVDRCIQKTYDILRSGDTKINQVTDWDWSKNTKVKFLLPKSK